MAKKAAAKKSVRKAVGIPADFDHLVKISRAFETYQRVKELENEILVARTALAYQSAHLDQTEFRAYDSMCKEFDDARRKANAGEPRAEESK